MNQTQQHNLDRTSDQQHQPPPKGTNRPKRPRPIPPPPNPPPLRLRTSHDQTTVRTVLLVEPNVNPPTNSTDRSSIQRNRVLRNGMSPNHWFGTTNRVRIESLIGFHSNDTFGIRPNFDSNYGDSMRSCDTHASLLDACWGKRR